MVCEVIKFTDTECRMVVTRDWEEGEKGSCYSVEIVSFSFARCYVMEICFTTMQKHLTLLNCTYSEMVNKKEGNRASWKSLQSFYLFSQLSDKLCVIVMRFDELSFATCNKGCTFN